jgi:hypothetical protein
MRRPNLSRILIAIFTIGTRTQANSPHPSPCEGHLSASRRNTRSKNLLVDDLMFQLQARRYLVARSLCKECLDVEAASIMPFESISHESLFCSRIEHPSARSYHSDTPLVGVGEERCGGRRQMGVIFAHVVVREELSND